MQRWLMVPHALSTELEHTPSSCQAQSSRRQELPTMCWSSSASTTPQYTDFRKGRMNLWEQL
eukprot:2737117-Amphidinium_carterae.1